MPFLESLEPRQLLAAVPIPANINLSKLAGNQSEGAIAIDPTHPNRIFAFSNLDEGDGLFTARSSNGGQTWSTTVIADSEDGLAPACCDPSASFDEFGNLFIGYVNSATSAALVARSTNGGRSFRQVAKFAGDIDQPTVTAGHGSVWVTFQKDSKLHAAGAAVTALGKMEKFHVPQQIPGAFDANFGDIAIGPEGQVMVTFESPSGTSGPASLFTCLNPDGLGVASFGSCNLATSTDVGGFRSIPAQPEGEIDAEPGLVYDRSGGEFNGRVYLIYTDASRARRNDTSIQLRFSDDDGANWSEPIRVDDDTTGRSQFLPRIALDQTTGNLAMTWHDARNDNGRAPGSTNNIKNDDAQLWGTTAIPTAKGVTIASNFQISLGTSNADRANNAIDYGDYHGLAFHGGVFFPIWADNSNSTGDNPNGKLKRFDIYIAKVEMPVIT